MSFKSAADADAGLPLGSLEAIVFDTETTGLSIAKDRVVEIAAVRIAAGRIKDDAFSTLVNPDSPIPAPATRIHGIADEDVSGAPDFGSAVGEFSNWAGPKFFLGYSLAFDLGVLEAEHRRHGLLWSPPRWLDVQHLVEGLDPELPDWSLDTVAAWCGVSAAGRHRALADARLTAEVFFALVPKLRAAGISTFAEAERACAKRHRQLEGGSHAAKPSPAGMENFDSYPFRNRVGDVMASPPVVVDPGTELRGAIAEMVERRIGSLFVAPEAGTGHGILTESDVLRAVHANPEALSTAVGAICSRPLKSVSPKEFVYRATVAMSRGGFRHMGVADDGGSLIGSISARDLIRDRSGGAAALGYEIETAESVADLGRVWSSLSAVAGALAREAVEPRMITAIVSRELRAMTSRACALAEAELEGDGSGRPPVPYAMLVLGSGGRGESMLAMDQDNAIIFESEEGTDEADSYFAKLGAKVADILDSAGVKRCPGGVMASNSAWRKDAVGWSREVAKWLARTRPEDIMNADIFFDAMPAHGDFGLAERLRAESLEAARSSRPFLALLARNASDFRVPLGLLGRWQLDKGRMDLKKGGLMPVFSAARAKSLERGISARSTERRLKALLDADAAPSKAVESLSAAHGILLEAVLRQQLRDIESGIAPSNLVAPREIDYVGQQRLRWALDQLRRINDLLSVPAQI